MKAKLYFPNNFLQLLAHRERGRTRLIAWSIGTRTGPSETRWKALLQSPPAGFKPPEATGLPRPGLLG